MLVSEMLLGIVHVAIRGAELFVPKDAFQPKLIATVHDVRDGSAMAEQVGMEARNTGPLSQPLGR